MTCTEHFIGIFAYFLVGTIFMILVRWGLDKVQCRCFVRCVMSQENTSRNNCCESKHELTWGVLLWPVVFPAALGLFLIRCVSILWMRHFKRSYSHVVSEGQNRIHTVESDRA
jgi:hypothetical protein